MNIKINPITEQLKNTVKKHGIDGWTVMTRASKCSQRNDQPATLVCKNNTMVWLLDKEIA